MNECLCVYNACLTIYFASMPFCVEWVSVLHDCFCVCRVSVCLFCLNTSVCEWVFVCSLLWMFLCVERVFDCFINYFCFFYVYFTCLFFIRIYLPLLVCIDLYVCFYVSLNIDLFGKSSCFFSCGHVYSTRRRIGLSKSRFHFYVCALRFVKILLLYMSFCSQLSLYIHGDITMTE